MFCRKDKTEEAHTDKNILVNIDNSEENHLASPQPLKETSMDQINVENGLDNNPVNHNYRDTFAEMLDKSRKQLDSAKYQLMKIGHKRIVNCLLGVCLKNIVESSDDDSFSSIELIEFDKSIKNNLNSEKDDLMKEVPKVEKCNLDCESLLLKLQALEESYLNKAKNLEEDHSGSISSENPMEDQKAENIPMEEISILKAESEADSDDVSESSEVSISLHSTSDPESIKSSILSKSVSVDDLKYLFDVAYCKNNQAGSSRSPVLSNTSNTYTPPFNPYYSPNLFLNESEYPLYDEISEFSFDNDTEDGKKNIQKHIIINEHIVQQVTELLIFGCQNRPQFLGCYIHLEAEKILLLAKIRHTALLEYASKSIEPLDKESSATIVLEKIDLKLNHCNVSPFVEHYYMCILEHETTVYGTDIMMSNEHGCISYEDRFVFENVTNTFDIKVSLYSMTVKPLTSICGSFSKRRPQGPMMTLIGVTHIDFNNANCQKFSFKNADDITEPEQTLSTTVGVTLTWPKPFKGFLNLGFSRLNRPLLWNERWCILQDGQLKYFNCPSDEIFCSPIGVINILDCTSIETSPFEYMMKKSLLLLFNTNQNRFEKLYISANSRQEQAMWFEKFEATVNYWNNWRALKN